MTYPIHRLSALAELTPRETESLVTLGDHEVSRSKGEVFQIEGDAVHGFHLNIVGWVTSSIMLPNGKRLIQKVHLPGDMLSTPNMVSSKAIDTLTAMTDGVTAFVPFTRFGRIYVDAPRLAALLTIAAQLERLALIDGLAMTGNASGKERIIRLLVDLHSRLTLAGMAKDETFELPLSQEMIGDLVGMTNVHVNRMLRNLEDAGFISRAGRRFTFLDLTALKRLCPLLPRRPAIDLAWLPPAV
jgi:CRP/FNR family transcriptional regulator